MGQGPYPYTGLLDYRYLFISHGRASIEKLVVFAPTPLANVFNLGFGDLLKDGSINDIANSNNGDLSKVLATVIEILREFTTQHPDTKIYIKGNTINRAAIYRRFMNTYYQTFKNEFTISALIETSHDFSEIPFDPDSEEAILAFFIKRM